MMKQRRKPGALVNNMKTQMTRRLVLANREGNSDDNAGEDYNIMDVEDNLNLNTTAFEQIMGKKDAVFRVVKFKYQRELVKSKRSRNQHKEPSRTLQEAASTMRLLAA
jgi:hypothetical protein